MMPFLGTHGDVRTSTALESGVNRFQSDGNTFLPQVSPLQFIHMSHSRHFPRTTLNTPMIGSQSMDRASHHHGDDVHPHHPPKTQNGQEVFCCFQEISDPST